MIYDGIDIRIGAALKGLYPVADTNEIGSVFGLVYMIVLVYNTFPDFFRLVFVEPFKNNQ